LEIVCKNHKTKASNDSAAQEIEAALLFFYKLIKEKGEFSPDQKQN
jgi:uncharacterized protein YfkK (UPF0435 family)